MPSVMVKAADAVVKAKREATARRVIAEFGPLPDHKLLCFFDDVDWEGLKAGKATRGLYSPVDDHILKAAPIIFGICLRYLLQATPYNSDSIMSFTYKEAPPRMKWD